MLAIETQGLTKFYGPTRGVEAVALEVRVGEVFGFLGPNGAGKTTTIRLLLDLLRPTSGAARVLGLDPRADGPEVRRRVGYLPGELSLYEKLTGDETLELARNLRGAGDEAFTRALAERIDARLDVPVRSLSQGNKRKIGLLVALAHRPELAILDEPTNGLDPLVQREFHALVRELKAAGTTVFLSSHNLAEVERTCDRVAIVRDGRIVAVDDVASLKARAPRRVAARFAAPASARDFEGVPGVSDLRVEDGALRCTVTGPLDPLVKALARHEVLDLAIHEPDLEDLVLAFYGRN